MALFLGCSTAPAPDRPGDLFGDDRVAESLSRDAARSPRTYVEHEALFGVGRSCARKDSREIFVIEERATRFNEVVIPAATPVPRVVVTGCAVEPSLPGSVATSFGYFAVMPTEPGRDARDPLARTPVEAMALDKTTGMYSFYVLDDRGVQRIVRDADGTVRTVIGARDGAVESRREAGARCFGCHVNGGPLMAAMADPWTSWVSTRSEKPVGSYDGETASIVTESNQLSTSKRAAFANALEGVVRNGIRAFVFGQPNTPGSGLGARVLDGREAGGVPRLLRSVFCETELQFASTFDTVPLQLFVDPAAAAGSGLTRPIATPGDTFPALLPIRSEIDLRIEEYLVTRGVLAADTVRAIRLLDDARDIFSDKRCGLLPRVVAKLPATNVDEVVRATIRASLDDHGRAVLDGRDDGREAYFTALRARVEAEIKGDRAVLAARRRERQERARRMFPGTAHPLPVLP